MRVEIKYKLATRVIQLFYFSDKPMKGGDLLDFYKLVNLCKGGMAPLNNYGNFFCRSDKELKKSRANAKKLGKRHWITTFWEHGP